MGLRPGGEQRRTGDHKGHRGGGEDKPWEGLMQLLGTVGSKAQVTL